MGKSFSTIVSDVVKEYNDKNKTYKDVEKNLLTNLQEWDMAECPTLVETDNNITKLLSAATQKRKMSSKTRNTMLDILKYKSTSTKLLTTKYTQSLFGQKSSYSENIHVKLQEIIKSIQTKWKNKMKKTSEYILQQVTENANNTNQAEALATTLENNKDQLLTCLNNLTETTMEKTKLQAALTLNDLRKPLKSGQTLKILLDSLKMYTET